MAEDNQDKQQKTGTPAKEQTVTLTIGQVQQLLDAADKKTAKAIDDDTSDISETLLAIWSEEKHRRNMFWRWFIAIIVIDALVLAITVNSVTSSIRSSIYNAEQSQYQSSDEDDSDDSDALD